MADDLLDVSRLEAGRFELDASPVPPAELVAEAVAASATAAQSAGLSLEESVGPGLPPVVADAGRIRRVLANLLANAVRHTPAGGRVAVRALPGEGCVRFEIEDTGEGIAAEDQERVFERFVQLPGSLAAGGTGLGLTLAKEIVEAHGGRIGVDSEPGRGSTFWFEMPAGE
jgi:signal transduction histidine kinase